jgi:maleate isomerase
MNGVNIGKSDRAMPAQRVRTDFALDEGPGRHRIGLVTLASDHVTERDFTNMRPSDDVVVYVSRIRNVNPCTVENLRKMAPKLTDSVSLMIPDGRLDSVAYSCTSGTVVIGYEAIAAGVRAARPDIPVATPITAGLDGLARFGARRIAVLTPYIDEVNTSIVGYIEAGGVDVVALTSFLFEDDNEMACIPPQAIYEAALEADRPEADALFISCTAIRAVDVVERIEQSLGKPVVTANQALYWKALRAAGCGARVEGYGSLMRLPHQQANLSARGTEAAS